MCFVYVRYAFLFSLPCLLHVIFTESMLVSPAVGGKGMEVLVQGKQVKAVLEVLGGRGVPRKWVDADGGDKK